MSQVVGYNNSYKPITNTACVRARLCKLQKSALDSQPQVIKFTSCWPMVGGSLRLPPPLKLVAMIQLKYYYLLIGHFFERRFSTRRFRKWAIFYLPGATQRQQRPSHFFCRSEACIKKNKYGNAHVVKFGKDPIYRTKVIMWKRPCCQKFYLQQR